jgi:hypothetical protein
MSFAVAGREDENIFQDSLGRLRHGCGVASPAVGGRV